MVVELNSHRDDFITETGLLCMLVACGGQNMKPARCFLCPAYSKSRQTDHSFDESPLQLQLMDSTGSGDTQPPTES